MQQVYPDGGLGVWLASMLGFNIYFGLYTAPTSGIDRSIVYSSLTEAAWTGYFRQGPYINPGNWTLSVVSHLGFGIGNPIAWNNGSGSPVTPYGYFFIDTASGPGNVIAVGQFDAAPITIAAGDSYVFIPSVGDLSKATTSP